MNDDELIAAWESDETAKAIADRTGISPNTILRGWKRLKLVGRLPVGDRPRSRAATALARNIDHSDGRASVLDVRGVDPLAEALSTGRR